MDVNRYFESLTEEFVALKNRVRFYIEDQHWLTDGEWKESVLRSMLRRHLPDSIGVGRGFVISPSKTSSQVDILLYDRNKPILFQDGDFVMVTPDATRGIIEVKTKVQKRQLPQILDKLCGNAQLVCSSLSREPRFFGLFSYENLSGGSTSVLNELSKAVEGNSQRIIHGLSFGDSTFIRYWHLSPDRSGPIYNKWHSYNLYMKAPAYFVHNVVDYLSPHWADQNNSIWYPETGKEGYKTGEIELCGSAQA